jgi:hypothetical protein
VTSLLSQLEYLPSIGEEPVEEKEIDETKKGDDKR